LFKDADESCTFIKTNGFPICLFQLPPEAITEIIMGCRASDDFKNLIKGILSKNRKLKHIVFKEAIINERKYKIDFVSS
jgi:hypothetical protein